jgi:hypothetical protein
MADTTSIDASDDAAAGDEGTREARGGPGSRSATTYPYYDLEEAEKFARGIASTGGTEASEEDVMKAIGLASTTTRAWSYRLSSAREFGLVTRGARSDGKLILTELGKQVVSPSSAPEQRAARLAAFLTPKLYKKLFDQYKGLEIPKPEFVQNALKSKHGLLDTVLATAAEAFIKSARYAGAVGLDHRLTGDAGTSAATNGAEVPPPPATPKPAGAQSIEVPADFILHRFQLRKELTLILPLPPDLTPGDVRRLHRWMETLPLDENSADSAGSPK